MKTKCLTAAAVLLGSLWAVGARGAEVLCDAKSDGCVSRCCDTCYLFGPDEAWELMSGDNCSGIKVGGWFQAGYHSDLTPLSAARGDALAFNDVPHAVNLHQYWLYAEKVAESDGSFWDWGFRTDLVYGTDAQKTQAFGQVGGWDTDWDNGVYGWAMPQLYAELARGDLSIKAGHFFTLIGYEVVTAPDNFFYSHALAMFNSEPFTHSGMLATYAVSDNLEAYGGWTAGWDTGFESVGGGSSFLGGFSYSLTDDISFTYITSAGDFGGGRGDAYSHSLVFDVAITERLNYVLQSDLLTIGETSRDDVDINQYVFYTLNDCLALGTRVEWWQTDGQSNYELTGGLNYRPHANVVIRPEVRWDHQPATSFDQTTFGIDAILLY